MAIIQDDVERLDRLITDISDEVLSVRGDSARIQQVVMNLLSNSARYSPPGKPNERMRIAVFILSRALRSDSFSISIERQQRSPTGQWSDAPIARDAIAELESAVLLRARHIRAERYRDTS